jgi:cyclin-dependent kinase 7
MAVSPLVPAPPPALAGPASSDSLHPSSSRPGTSPLKRPSSAAPSGAGTPLRGPPDNLSALLTMDLAEKLNEDEKNKYIKGRELGEGTYAVVYEGRLKSDPNLKVAIKKIKVQKEYQDGMAPDAVRELKFLQELQHPNIISLLSVFTSRDQNLNLVLEHLPLGDLEMLIRDTDRVRYGAPDIKAWMGMLCRAVAFCHASFVLHRDIKPNNLLISASGTVKLADFGLARAFADPFGPPMTSNVITRWYRPPELLFGARRYGGAVDVWSVGAVFAELVLRAPFLPGNTEVEQIALICRAVGTPTEDNWPGVTRLKSYAVPGDAGPARGRDAFMAQFGIVGAEGVDLLMKTLELDPGKRISAEGILRHAWWRAEPRPTRDEDLPRKSEREGEGKMGADLKRRPGVLDQDRGKKVARKLDFGQKK